MPNHARNNFDFLRFVLASLVVLSHAYPGATGTERNEPLSRITGGQLTFGAFAVDAFFIASGYLIARSWLVAPAIGVFLGKRIRRIYPGFLIAAVLGAFVVVPLFSTAGYAAIHADFVLTFVGKALRLIAIEPPESFPHNPSPGTANGSLWSIAYEFWCYFIVLVCGLLGWLTRARLLWAVLLAAIVVSLVFAVSGIHPGGSYLGLVFGYPPLWARLLPYFLVGMALQASGRAIVLNAKGALACGACLVLSAQVPYGLSVVLPIASAYLLLWLAYLPVPKLHRFASHGDFSYGIYLYSFPILQIVMALRGRPWEPLWLFVVAWPLSVLAAALSWHGLEKHFIARRRDTPSGTPSARSVTGNATA